MNKTIIRSGLLLLLSIWGFTDIIAQDSSPAGFGQVTAADFAPAVYPIDSNANAIVIASIGNSDEDIDSYGEVVIKFNVYKRLRILNKNGYNTANVSFTINTGNEDLKKIRAATYNLENGQVVKTDLDIKKELYKNDVDKYTKAYKFTFPNLREGSIIEYEYTISSKSMNIRPWLFQDEIPTLWSEYTVTTPSFIKYMIFSNGYHQADVQTQRSMDATYHIFTRYSGIVSYNEPADEHRWVHKNVPAIKEEKYISTLANDIASIQFQLSSTEYPMTASNILISWPEITKHLMDDDNFGAQVYKNNHFINDDLKAIVSNITDKRSQAAAVYKYIQDNIKSTGGEGIFTSKPLKDVLSQKNGNIAGINLLLTAMLRKLDLDADPVILSTRPHGYTMPLYPIMSQYNYVVCRLNLDKEILYLDATDPLLGFGKLNEVCYNSVARVINAAATQVDLGPGNITESVAAMLTFKSSEDGLECNAVYVPGYFESKEIREKIRDKGMKSYEDETQKKLGSNYTLSSLSIDSLSDLDQNIKVHYNIDVPLPKDSLIYINPILINRIAGNPFKQPLRNYPVEMPYDMKENIICTMPVPEGYAIDELPKPLKLKIDATDAAVYNYVVNAVDNTIVLRSQLLINKPVFMPSEYAALRTFYDEVVKKENEMIVLKKIQ